MPVVGGANVGSGGYVFAATGVVLLVSGGLFYGGSGEISP